LTHSSEPSQGDYPTAGNQHLRSLTISLCELSALPSELVCASLQPRYMQYVLLMLILCHLLSRPLNWLAAPPHARSRHRTK
jgi:hypothetical protein